MQDKEAIQMMYRCRDEIKGLRGRLSVVEPKAEAWDVLAKVVHAGFGERSMGASEDLVWRLEREIKNLEEAQAKPEGN